MSSTAKLTAIAAAFAVIAGACTLDNEPEPVPPSTTAAATSATTSTTAPGPPATAPAGDRAVVVGVLDGDSIVVDIAGSEEEVRLIGINAPEGGECYADRARDALEGRLGGQTVTLVADAGSGDRDRFGRLLRYAYLDAIPINESMIRNGFAQAMSSGHPLQREYLATEEAAYAEGAGMWSPGACGGPQAQQAIDIVRVEHDPPGPDEEDLNGEWVEVRNDGELAADAGGWILRDQSSTNRFVFPDAFTLPPDGAIVRIRTGCGTDTAEEVFWCASEPVWNNAGDTAVLQDDAGTVISRLNY